MTGLVRKATLFTACGLLIAGAAMASVPSAANSTVPCAIKVVGNNGTTTSNNHPITIVVRDLANNPINNSSVVIDFTNCNNFKNPGPSSVQLDPNVTVDCVTHTVRGLTNASGSVTLNVAGLGQAYSPGVPAGACARVFADGVLLRTVQAAAFDLEAAIPSGPGLQASDLSRYLQYQFAFLLGGTYSAIADYDYVGGNCATQSLSPADLSIWLTEFLPPAKSALQGAICP